MLDVSRSSVSYRPAPIPEEDLALLRRIDEIHPRFPFMGPRKTRDMLQRQGYGVNPKKVQRLLRLMDIIALYPKKRRTSLPQKGHKIRPYLLRDVPVLRPNPVWSAEICNILMARGFLYRLAIMDWYTSKVLSWRLSNTLDTEFCVEALEKALYRYGAPEIFNTN